MRLDCAVEAGNVAAKDPVEDRGHGGEHGEAPDDAAVVWDLEGFNDGLEGAEALAEVGAVGRGHEGGHAGHAVDGGGAEEAE